MLLTLLSCVPASLLCFSPIGSAQNPTPTPPQVANQEPSEVLRVFTQLVQTDVMVFDKGGQFVNGLTSSDFELRIDGKLKPIEFFEKITAGSINEESQLAAARGTTPREETKSTGPAPLDRGRPIFFYVDDLHLDLGSVAATRKLITHFINKEMRQNDEAAIASASGQIGFLQQLTNNKAVLRAALERLQFRPYTVRDFARTPMSEYNGFEILRGERDINDYFIQQTMDENPGIPRDTAAAMVQIRARQIVKQGSSITGNTLTGLESLVRSANKLPGRKIVFFVSGGFLLDDRHSDSVYRLQRITSAAARSGVVIYSIDARGLVASLTDASTPSQPDATGRILRSGQFELIATQDAMNALAADTGGKATFNTNMLELNLGQALKKTSTYYLLAWKPDNESKQSSKFRRIEVKVVNKPNLTVQVRRGFFDREPEQTEVKSAKTDKSDKDEKPVEAVSSEAKLRKVIGEPYPARDIPISLSVSYVNMPTKGPLLTAALEAPNEFFSFVPLNGKQSATVTVAGAIFDSKGNPGATFSNRLTIEMPNEGLPKPVGDLTYGFPIYVRPGLYQVRAGVRDDRSGRSGTAHSWIEIPNVSSGELALSSLMMGLRKQPMINNASATPDQLMDPVDFSVSRHFSPTGFLRFLVVIYNASLAPDDAKPDVAIQVQVLRDDQPVVTTALKKVSVQGLTDTTRIPFAAEVALKGLPAGRYILQEIGRAHV